MIIDSANKFKDLFQQFGHRVTIVNDILWRDYQKMVLPIGPANQNYYLSVSDKKYLLKYFRGSILVRATKGFIDSPCQWYCVIRDKHIPLENMVNKVHQRHVKYGLKKCLVQRINTKVIEKEGWPVFSAAFRRYKNPSLQPTEKQFKQEIIKNGFEDIFHYWGVFEKTTGRLIAYAYNYLYGKVEVYYSTVYVHPDFLHLYPSYALRYESDRYYLDELKFSYANAGFRNLFHETNIHRLLIEKFAYKKQPVELNIHYRPFLG